MDELGEAAAAGIPIVGLEPACVAAFRDELVNLFPDDERAVTSASAAMMLSELLAQDGYQPPRLERKALVHTHCNHRAVMGVEAELAMLDRLGLDYSYLADAGCCGMAGSFGFERDHYEVSRRIGERVLLPAVREADAGHADHHQRLQLHASRSARRPAAGRCIWPRCSSSR